MSQRSPYPSQKVILASLESAKVLGLTVTGFKVTHEGVFVQTSDEKAETVNPAALLPKTKEATR